MCVFGSVSHPERFAVGKVGGSVCHVSFLIPFGVPVLAADLLCFSKTAFTCKFTYCLPPKSPNASNFFTFPSKTYMYFFSPPLHGCLLFCRLLLSLLDLFFVSSACLSPLFSLLLPSLPPPHSTPVPLGPEIRVQTCWVGPGVCPSLAVPTPAPALPRSPRRPEGGRLFPKSGVA